MKTYTILTAYGTTYQIDEDGCFLQYNEHRWEHPHDSWKCTGAAQLLPFGHFRNHSLPTFLAMIEQGKCFTFKNGKPRFTLTDLDHGTYRIHGNTKYHGIRTAWVNAKEAIP